MKGAIRIIQIISKGIFSTLVYLLFLEKNNRMKQIFIVCLLGLTISSCTKENPYLMAKNKLGPLDNATRINQVEPLFSVDSVVVTYPESAFGTFIKSEIKKMEVYDTTGIKHLIIEPRCSLDTISFIKSIRLVSARYKTENGIGFGSTFGELKKYHDVTNIQSSIKSVILTLDDLNAFVSFDREVLPNDVRFDTEAEIKPIMIPDDATINRFWLNFDAEEIEEK